MRYDTRVAAMHVKCDEPCVGPKDRVGRLLVETTLAVLGQRRRYAATRGSAGTRPDFLTLQR